MPFKVNIRLLKEETKLYEGELAPDEVVGDVKDELVRPVGPLRYSMEVGEQDGSLTVIGRMEMPFECDCGRCLKTFPLLVEIPEFAALVPLSGEDAAVVDGDFADLTPFLREDTVLALPTNPLCDPECRGLVEETPARDLRLGRGSAPGEEPAKRSAGTKSSVETPTNDGAPGGGSPWGELDRLKL